MTSEYTVERFLEYVRTSRAKNTLIMYREGLKRFTEWYGKTADEILKNLGVTMTAEQFTKMTFGEKLDMIAKEQERKQREEYARIIAENNNNNH